MQHIWLIRVNILIDLFLSIHWFLTHLWHSWRHSSLSKVSLRGIIWNFTFFFLWPLLITAELIFIIRGLILVILIELLLILCLRWNITSFFLIQRILQSVSIRISLSKLIYIWFLLVVHSIISNPIIPSLVMVVIRWDFLFTHTCSILSSICIGISSWHTTLILVLWKRIWNSLIIVRCSKRLSRVI